MPPAPSHVFRLEIQPGQFTEALRSLAGKVIEDLAHFPALNRLLKAFTSERWKIARFAELHDRVHARHPIVTLRVCQVTHDLNRAPRAFTLVASSPLVGKAAQQGIDPRGRLRQQRA